MKSILGDELVKLAKAYAYPERLTEAEQQDAFELAESVVKLARLPKAPPLPRRSQLRSPLKGHAFSVHDVWAVKITPDSILGRPRARSELKQIAAELAEVVGDHGFVVDLGDSVQAVAEPVGVKAVLSWLEVRGVTQKGKLSNPGGRSASELRRLKIMAKTVLNEELPFREPLLVEVPTVLSRVLKTLEDEQRAPRCRKKHVSRARSSAR